MQLKELLTELRINLADTNSEKYSEAQYVVFLNRALRKVWKDLMRKKVYLKRRRIDVPFVAGTQESLIDHTAQVPPRSIAKIISVVDADGRPLEVYDQEFAIRSPKPCFYIARQTLNESGAVGGDIRYDKLGYYIVPGNSFTVTVIVNDHITIFSAATTTSTEIRDIPCEHHDILVTYATIQAMLPFKTPPDIMNKFTQLYDIQFEDLVGVDFDNLDDRSVLDINEPYLE